MELGLTLSLRLTRFSVIYDFSGFLSFYTVGVAVMDVVKDYSIN